MIAAGIATIRGREESLKDVLTSLVPQTDLIFVSHSGDCRFENLWPGKVVVIKATGTDERKFKGCRACRPGDVFFSCDDDLIYPADYVEKTMQGLKEDVSIVTHHGRTIESPVKSYYKSWVNRYYCLGEQKDENAFVNVPGTGVTAFRIEAIQPKDEDFPKQFPLMADIHFGILAQKLKLQIKVLTHPAGWIRQNPKADERQSIYSRQAGNERLQVRRCNTITWK